ncbi:MAG: sensor histidine kinase [Flavobacteriales bacterium]
MSKINSASSSTPKLSELETANALLQEEIRQRKESDLRFRLAVKGTTAGVWDWIDVNSNQEWWSPQFYNLLGYSPEELDATLENFEAILHPEDSARTFELVNKHFENRESFVVEYRLKCKTGKYRWFLGSGQATWDVDGKPTRMVGTIVDIHERKTAEAAAKQNALDLKKKVTELQELTYVASHDLQEPVRTIASFADLLKQNYTDKLDTAGNQYLDFMQEASNRSQQLISDLLDYTRIGKNQEVTDVDTQQILSVVLADLTSRIKDSGAKIDADQLPIIKGYPIDLQVLIQNLLSNAIKFSASKHQPLIKIGYENLSSEHHFFVADNGIGIEEQYFDRIFVIFKRLNARAEFEGTGIGLAHCKKVIELHNGKIWVESKVDKGSTFHFTIPHLP